MKIEIGKVKSFFKGLGFFILGLFLTLLTAGIFIYLLGNVWKLNNNITGGVPILTICYFWGIFFLRKHGLRKFLGIVLFILGVLFNLLLIVSPYDKQAEFISTRIFIIPALAAGIFLIFRHSIASRVFGILLLIISIFAALLGAVFMSTKL